MRVLVFSERYLPGYKGGGPIKTIRNLLANTRDRVTYRVVTSDRDLGDKSPYVDVNYEDWNLVGGSEVFYIPPGLGGLWRIFRILKCAECDVVYINSFFSFSYSIFPQLLSLVFGRRVLLSPRGEFSLGALGLKFLKKKIFILIYKLLSLHDRVVFQASSDFEKNDIFRVMGGGVDVWVAENIGSMDFANDLALKEMQVLKVVFLSRISPKKNLAYTIQILSRVKQRVDFYIFGPVEDASYWDHFCNEVKSLASNVKVIYGGALAPNEVVNKIAKYDLFLLPTMGENYGHVIAEALCAGLPLLISDTTPWRDLEAKGVGWDLSLSDASLFSLRIDHVSEMSSEDHHAMRLHVLAWARQRFCQRDNIYSNISMFHYVVNRR